MNVWALRLTLVATAMWLAAATSEAQTVTTYRGFVLGASVQTTAVAAEAGPETLTLVHERPARLELMRVRPSRWSAAAGAPSTDPVEEMRFSFHNGQLFRLIVDYGQERTAGMTRADVIAALTEVYGTPLSVAARKGVRLQAPPDTEASSILAVWGDATHALALYHTEAYDATFRLMLVDLRLDAASRQADTVARRMDEEEAPRREAARLKQEADDRRTTAERSRTESNRLFVP